MPYLTGDMITRKTERERERERRLNFQIIPCKVSINISA